MPIKSLLLALPLCVAGCSLETRSERERRGEATAAKPEALREACASPDTYERLKAQLFQDAVRVRKAESPLLRQLAATTVVRMEDPVVKSRDNGLDVTVCGGRMLLELPPGVTDAFDGERRLAADVEYAAQAAADGSGLVFQIDGAEPIVYRLASVALGERPATVAAPAVAAPPPLVARASVPPRAAPVAPGVRGEVAEPPPQRRGSPPSFDCRDARTRGERAVCSDGKLAAMDRVMASRYQQALASTGRTGQRVLRDSRDRFLAFRDRCRDDICIARAYGDRVNEIEDIAASF